MKVVMISSMLPTGHYTQILANALDSHADLDLIVYSDRDKDNEQITGCGTVKRVWSPGAGFIVDILRELKKDKPDIVHIQHEFNMYGGMMTAALFPVLLMFIRMLGYPVVTTIHGVVSKKQLNDTFFDLFFIKKSFVINTVSLSLFFHAIYLAIGLCSSKVICHTDILRGVLLSDYGLSSKKVVTIPTIIPEKKRLDVPRQPYFFYFGYIVRRKGLEQVIDGFKKFSKQFPTFSLILAGGTIKGQEQARQEIQNYIENHGLQKKILLKGYIKTEEELALLYGKAYAVVIPAIFSIAASGPLYQAQGYGKCILASDVGNFKEEIHHQTDGILVDNSKWNEALTEIAKNEKLLQLLAEGTRNRARKKSPQQMSQQYAALYSKLITK